MRELCHIAHRVWHAQGSRCACECALETPSEGSCLSSASHPRAEIRAEAYHSMTSAHGQRCHVSAAVCQVHVVEQSRARRPARNEKAALRASVSETLLLGGSIYRNLRICKNRVRGETREYFLSHKRPSARLSLRPSNFAKVISMNPPSRVVCFWLTRFLLPQPFVLVLVRMRVSAAYPPPTHLYEPATVKQK